MSGKPKWGRAPEGYRYCSSCGTMLELNSCNFHKSTSLQDGGFQYRCKSCIKKANAQARDNGNWKRYHYKSVYGITPEKKQEMINEQEGCCAICHEPFGNRRICIDHNHITGKIRRILCNNCNSILGMSNERILVLESAIEYLRRYGE